MSDRAAAAYEVCLQALQTGASLEACLSLYPDLAEELRPALQAAAWMTQQPFATPSSAAQARSRSRVLTRAARARSQRRLAVLRHPIPRLAFVLAALLIAFTASWGGLTTAAAQSLPGDSLYRVKRAQETLRLQLVRDEQTRQNLQLSFKERREDEVRELLRLGRKGSVTFEGVVEAQDVEGWMVSSLPVGLNTETEIVGQIKPGDSVIVMGTTRPQGDILASKIQLHTYQLIGTVDQQSPGLWTVAGQPLVLLPISQVQTGIVPGDRVLVLVEVTATGGHEALVILSLATEAVPVGASTPIPPGGPPSTPAPSVDDGNEVTVEFSGFVEGHDGLTWTVAGQTLLQTSQSEIRGNLGVGDRVRVRALTRTDGGLILLRIEPTDSQSENDDKATPDAEPTDDDGENEGSSTPEPPDDEPEEIRFSGEISSVSAGQWVIDGQTLRITGDTEIDADLKVGDRADVRARRFPDGHLEADRIEEAD